MTYARLILAFASALVFAGCSHEVSVVYQAPSPDGSGKIQLVTFSRLPLVPRSVAQLELSGRSGKKVIKTWEASEMYPCFVAAAWTRDSEAVVVLFRDCWHKTDLVAFDVSTGKTIDPSKMTSALADEIRSQYSLSKSISDPIVWATETEEARTSFARSSSH
jgi:hypothetical protein